MVGPLGFAPMFRCWCLYLSKQNCHFVFLSSFIGSLCATWYDLRQFNARRHMSLLIGNMKSAVSFYPVGKKACQVSKRSGGKLVSSLFLLLLHRNKIMRQEQHWFLQEGILKKKRKWTVPWLFVFMVLWKALTIQIRLVLLDIFKHIINQISSNLRETSLLKSSPQGQKK